MREEIMEVHERNCPQTSSRTSNSWALDYRS